MFGLVKQSVAINRGLRNEDCERLKINFAYWLVLYKDVPLDEMMQQAKAIVAHYFNIHTWCSTWCYWLMEHGCVPRQDPKDKKKYCCIHQNKEMYELLMEKLEGYITEDKLKQSQYPYSTQPNKASHNAINQSAPKSIDYS